jgi:hypothetical protein
VRLYSRTHEARCGIDLHARTMYACLLSRGHALTAREEPRQLSRLVLRTALELFDSEADVRRDLANQDRRDVAPGMKGHRRAVPARLPVLSMGAALPDFDEAAGEEKGCNLARLQRRNFGHALADFE